MKTSSVTAASRADCNLVVVNCSVHVVDQKTVAAADKVVDGNENDNDKVISSYRPRHQYDRAIKVALVKHEVKHEDVDVKHEDVDVAAAVVEPPTQPSRKFNRRLIKKTHLKPKAAAGGPGGPGDPSSSSTTAIVPFEEPELSDDEHCMTWRGPSPTRRNQWAPTNPKGTPGQLLLKAMMLKNAAIKKAEKKALKEAEVECMNLFKAAKLRGEIPKGLELGPASLA